MSTLPQNGTDYGALQANNPYRNYQYTRGLWDNVGDWMNKNLFFGQQVIKTPEQKYRDEMANQARAYDAQIAEVAREEAYNSSAEQAARMRDAGINPDLQSSGITGGEASPMDNQATMNLPQTTDDLESTRSVVKSLMSLPSAISGLLQGMPDLVNKVGSVFNGLESGNLDNLDKLGNTMQTWVIDHINEFDGIKSLSDFMKSDLYNNFLNSEEAKRLFPFGYQRKRAAIAMYNKAKSMVTGAELFDTQGNYLASKNNPLNFDETIVRSITQYNAWLMDYRLKYESDYYKYADGILKASSENNQNLWNKVLYGSLEGLVKYYESLYEETNDARYNLAVMAVQNLMSGHLDAALGLAATSAVAGGIGDLNSPSSATADRIAGELGETPTDQEANAAGRDYRDNAERIADNARDAVIEWLTGPRHAHDTPLSGRRRREARARQREQYNDSLGRKRRKHGEHTRYPIAH